jgi:hypothetical protein
LPTGLQSHISYTKEEKMKPINSHFILAGCMVCISLWLAGCSGTASSEPSSPGPASSIQASSGSSTGASFSAIVDGTKFSSSIGTDNLNAAFVVNEDGQKKLFFMLADPDNPVQKLNFDLPYKAGATTILTVNVTTLGATRVSGTFSGNYRLENVNTPNARVSLQRYASSF